MLNKEGFNLASELTPGFYTYLIRDKVLHLF